MVIAFIPATTATLPAGGEAAVGPLVYELLEAAVGTRGNDRALALRIRAANHGRYDATFSDGSFRLQIDDETRAPDSGLSDIVAAESTEGELGDVPASGVRVGRHAADHERRSDGGNPDRSERPSRRHARKGS